MWKNRRIAIKLFAVVFVSCTLIFGAIFGCNYFLSRKIITDIIKNNAKNITTAFGARIENELADLERVPENIAMMLEAHKGNMEDLQMILELFISSYPEYYGAGVIFEPVGENREIPSPYVYKDVSGIKRKDLTLNARDPRENAWYEDLKKEQKSGWGLPPADRIKENDEINTYSVPFFRTEEGIKKFGGIIFVDVLVNEAKKMISAFNVEEGGYSFYLTPRGETYFPDEDEVFKGPDGRFIHEHAIEAAKGKDGLSFFEDPANGNRYWLFLVSLPGHLSHAGMIFTEATLMSKLIKLHQMIGAVAVAGILVFLGVIAVIAFSMTRPLRMLAEKTNAVSSGDFNFELPEKVSSDEIGMLIKSFASMRDALKKYISEVVQASAEKERLESELKLANNIQMNMVPKSFPLFPEKEGIDCWGALEPAREVGGDLYNIFALDEHRIFVVIGDVAGKGIPAALFMMMVMTAVKALAHIEPDPARVLEILNEEIASGNDECMFVTIQCAVVDMKNGVLNIANAGHNPPVLIGSDRSISLMAIDPGKVLGVFRGEKYQAKQIKLNDGDKFVMYTDGITEAFNAHGEAFGEERLIAAISALSRESSQGIVEGVLGEVHKFSEGMAASDDITLVSFTYHPKQKIAVAPTDKIAKAFVSISPYLSELKVIETFVNAFARRHGLSDEVKNDVRLALTELFTNSVSYNEPGTTIHKATVLLKMYRDHLEISYEDDGSHFDPTKYLKPDLKASLEEKKIGGLGLHLVEKVMDSVKYEWLQGKNRTTMIRKI